MLAIYYITVWYTVKKLYELGLQINFNYSVLFQRPWGNISKQKKNKTKPKNRQNFN